MDTVPRQLGPDGWQPVLPRHPLVGGRAAAGGLEGGQDGLPLDRRLHGTTQAEFLALKHESARVGFSDIHPTLYVVSP